MMTRIALATVLCAASLVLAAAPAGATPLQSLKLFKDAGTAEALAQTVYYRGCPRVRRMCTYRWPGLGWRFRRCLRIRGC